MNCAFHIDMNIVMMLREVYRLIRCWSYHFLFHYSRTSAAECLLTADGVCSVCVVRARGSERRKRFAFDLVSSNFPRH